MMEVARASGASPPLEALTELALEAGAERLAAAVQSLGARVRDGLFYVACVGQFKRGKSTLINALLNRDILPAGVVPVTAVVTVLRHGEEEGARVRLAAREWQPIPIADVARYVTEKQNPENQKGVTAIEIFVPAALLSTGMCLVDTPGIGSVFIGNTETTRAFVPHVDAALVVLGADPPISADELALIEEIGQQCDDLIFVLNKADRLSDTERTEASDFTRQLLADRLGRADVTLYEVSATECLTGGGPARGWPGLVAQLAELAQHSGSELVRAAEQRGLALLAGRLRHHLDEERGALLRPVEQSERRIAALRACVADAERSLGELEHLMTAEQERLERIFDAKREQFHERAVPRARRDLRKALRTAEIQRGPALRRKAVLLADEVATRWLDRWLRKAQPASEALYVEGTRRFVDLANSFLEKLATTGNDALTGLPPVVAPETGFRVRSRLYYTSLMTLTTQTPFGWLLDLLRPRKRQLQVLDREVGSYLERLIFANANRIERDFCDRVRESRRRLGTEIRSALRDVAASAERALERARQRRADGSQAVQEELDRINTLSARLEALGLERKGSTS
jgi:GTP-binding protein EngB required for normal cell division